MVWREPSRLVKDGGCCAIRIPPKVRDALQLLVGDMVLLTVVDDQVILSKFDAERILPRREARQLARENMKPLPEVSHGG